MAETEYRTKIKYPFLMIPVEVEKMGLDVFERSIYQRITFRAGGNSSHFESQENMAKALFISMRQIIRKIKSLEQKKMIEVEKRGKNKDGHYLTNIITLTEFTEWIYPSHHVTHSHTAMCTTVTPPCDSQSHITRSQFNQISLLTINAAIEQPAAEIENKVKKEKKPTWKPKSSSKIWGEKSEEEKIQTLIQMTTNAQRKAVTQKKAHFYHFDDIPDLLMPIIKLHGNEAVKLFLDKLCEERRGCDVRRLGAEIIRGMDDNGGEREPIIRKEEGQQQNEKSNFVDKLVNHLEVSMGIAKNIMKENKDIVESYPPLFKKFYLEINDKKSRLRIQKEINTIGFDKFFKLRAPSMLRCLYEDLFSENPPVRTFL